MYDPRYVLRCFDTLSSDKKVAILQDMLESLVLADVLYLQDNPGTPGVYEAGLQYEPEEIGHDDWRDIPAVLDHKGGDCFPHWTPLLVVDDDGVSKLRPISVLEPGMRIWGLEQPTRVVAVADKGTMSLDLLSLEGGASVLLTPDHHVYLDTIDRPRVRVADLQGGEPLIMPAVDPTGRGRLRGSGRRTVEHIVRSAASTRCFDIETESGFVYLPEHDVTVSNCEDLACYRVAELRVRSGESCKPYISWQIVKSAKYGSFTLYHIRVLRKDGSIEDPSKILGMP